MFRAGAKGNPLITHFPEIGVGDGDPEIFLERTKGIAATAIKILMKNLKFKFVALKIKSGVEIFVKAFRAPYDATIPGAFGLDEIIFDNHKMNGQTQFIIDKASYIVRIVFKGVDFRAFKIHHPVGFILAEFGFFDDFFDFRPRPQLPSGAVLA